MLWFFLSLFGKSNSLTFEKFIFSTFENTEVILYNLFCSVINVELLCRD